MTYLSIFLLVLEVVLKKNASIDSKELGLLRGVAMLEYVFRYLEKVCH